MILGNRRKISANISDLIRTIRSVNTETRCLHTTKNPDILCFQITIIHNRIYLLNMISTIVLTGAIYLVTYCSLYI